MDFLSGLAAWGIDSLYSLSHNYGWAMMLLALGVSLLLLPLSLQSLKSMQEMQALAPYLKRLQAKHKNDKTKLGEAIPRAWSQSARRLPADACAVSISYRRLRCH